jgi:DNA repair protein RecN (Recombination protein N)
MLADLRIENLAVVERAHAAFAPGLNVISGETGAGKTILLQALQLALGGRAHSELVRAGTDAAWIEARFELSGGEAERVSRRLDERGLPVVPDGVLIVRRRVSSDGKSRAYINDASATVGALAAVTEGLVELTGQHEQFGLLRAQRHRELLDAFAGTGGLVEVVGAAVRALRAAEARGAELRDALAHRHERHEFLRFYLTEYDRIQPRLGEDEVLLEESHRLRHAEKLRLGLSRARALLYEGPSSAYERLSAARGELQPLTSADRRLEGVLERLDALEMEVDDLARELSRFREGAVAEPARLEEVEARLHDLQRLCRKHGAELDAVVEKMEAARRELEQLGDLELHLEEAERARAEAEARALDAAAGLTDRRREAISGLVGATEAHLRDLGFLRAGFEIALTSAAGTAGLTETGADEVTFLIAANPGQPARPLGKVASGGELSRMLLALKCALAGLDTAPVQVLDEIDTGIGGAAGEIVGRKIRRLADRAQVLCVTHLPQIASFADAHLVVVKEALEGATRTELRILDARSREDEVARMLGGMQITETTREHAREMLGRARVAS